MITKKLIFFLLFIKFLVFNCAYGQLIFTWTEYRYEGSINSVAFSPDGQYVAFTSSDNTIKLWSLSTGEKIRTLGGQRASVTSVAFSPDGKLLASGINSVFDRTIKLWNVSTGREVRTLTGHEWGVHVPLTFRQMDNFWCREQLEQIASNFGIFQRAKIFTL